MTCWWVFFHDWQDTDEWTYEWIKQKCTKCKHERYIMNVG